MDNHPKADLADLTANPPRIRYASLGKQSGTMASRALFFRQEEFSDVRQ
ncbi:hypothetical protein [Mesorhizobium sp.]|nr:hypothetical protein [Mesorhizobium sp.]